MAGTRLRACVEEAELKQQLRARREEQKEAKRLAALREVSSGRPKP